MTPSTAPRRQRRIQEQIARADKKHPKEKVRQAMQAGARPYPAPPFPKQHQSKPGSEAELRPAPFCDAPFYIGSKKLENKVALISGDETEN